tara:strand:+ start:108 stop:476 length:369 start_codon:yes stop_codon:yes gene_type:complete
MAVQYKNAVKHITTTGAKATLYTCPTSTSLQQFSAVIKTFSILNTGSAGTCDVYIIDSSASATIDIKRFSNTEFTAGTTVNVIENGNVIVLESGDSVQIDNSVGPADCNLSIMEISEELRGV